MRRGIKGDNQGNVRGDDGVDGEADMAIAA